MQGILHTYEDQARMEPHKILPVVWSDIDILVVRARHQFAAKTGDKFRIESYPLVASSQHVGAAAVVTILQLEFMLVEQ